MKFLCDSCNTKYSISDERVRGRVLKIRCKKCDFVITVREDAAAAAVIKELPSDHEIGKAFDSTAEDDGDKTMVGDLDSVGSGPGVSGSGGASGKEAEDWYVSFDGEQEGPFALARALERVRAEKNTDKEAHAWRPGFLVWLPVAEVPELAPALAGKLPPLPARAPVRATTPTPIGAGRGSGAISAQIARDPSGPRAALGVSAGARPAPRATPAPGTPSLATRPAPPGLGAPSLARKTGAPPIPGTVDAKGPVTGLPARNRGASGSFPVNGPSAIGELPPAASLSSKSPSKPGLAAAAPGVAALAEAGAPDLVINNEASGLVSIERLALAAMGKPSGPVMINGHTGRLPTPVQPVLAREPLESVIDQQLARQAENPTGSAPVFVVAGPAPSGPNPLFKWAALVALIACVGLGGGVWYLLTHRPPPDTIIVTEPARRADDSPITVTDPVTGKAVPVTPEAKKAATSARKATTPRPAGATGKGELSGSQKALADLYKDDGDRATPRDIAATARPGAGAGGQVSQAAILAVVTANRRALNLCYERVLKHDQSLKQGRVVTQVNVGISGRVSSVTIPDAQYANSELGQCFVAAVKRWNFPASDAPYATEFPFILQGQ